MSLIIWLLFGALVGWLASLITNQDREMGCFTNIAVGIMGSAIGSVISQELTGQSIRRFTFSGLVFSVLGAVIFLMILNILSRRKTR